MSELKVKGTLIQVLKPESGESKSGKAWNKQEFVIETQEQFPKKVCFTLFGDKTSLIDGIADGSEIEVFFNLESREFNGKYFHNINCWKIEGGEAKQNTTGGGVTYASNVKTNLPPSEMAATAQEPESDDLPF